MLPFATDIFPRQLDRVNSSGVPSMGVDRLATDTTGLATRIKPTRAPHHPLATGNPLALSRTSYAAESQTDAPDNDQRVDALAPTHVENGCKYTAVGGPSPPPVPGDTEPPPCEAIAAETLATGEPNRMQKLREELNTDNSHSSAAHDNPLQPPSTVDESGSETDGPDT